MSTQTPPEKLTTEVRAKFEAWASSQGMNLSKSVLDRGTYSWSNTQDSWRGWEASALSHLEGAQADAKRLDWLTKHELDVVFLGDKWACIHEGQSCYESTAKTCREAIDSAMAAQTEGERP